jgi:hypothetical protein
VNETSRPGPGRPPPDPTGIDAYAPAEIAARVEKASIGKARLTGISLMGLAMLAGAFIAFGAMLYTLVMTGSGLGFGVARLERDRFRLKRSRRWRGNLRILRQ